MPRNRRFSFAVMSSGCPIAGYAWLLTLRLMALKQAKARNPWRLSCN